LKRYFPAINQDFLSQSAIPAIGPSPEYSEEVLSILLSHVPIEPCTHDLLTSGWLCYIIAARAACPGHLWVAMGLFERPQLTAAIRRHLPSLAEANHQNMRWKRYLFKQVCDLNGGMMCKAPNCGVCSDYALCFAEE
jgi:nitrogen fixation protein NifQ